MVKISKIFLKTEIAGMPNPIVVDHAAFSYENESMTWDPENRVLDLIEDDSNENKDDVTWTNTIHIPYENIVAVVTREVEDEEEEEEETDEDDVETSEDDIEQKAEEESVTAETMGSTEVLRSSVPKKDKKIGFFGRLFG